MKLCQGGWARGGVEGRLGQGQEKLEASSEGEMWAAPRTEEVPLTVVPIHPLSLQAQLLPPGRPIPQSPLYLSISERWDQDTSSTWETEGRLGRGDHMEPR